MTTSTYAAMRAPYRPSWVRVLLIGESAPASGSGDLRFFYSTTLNRRDNLFRGIVQAMFDESPGHAGIDKSPWLARLKAEGIYLIDLVPYPIDKLSPRDRAQARRDHGADCVAQASALEPAGIVVCHSPTFDVLAPHLRAARLPLLHQERIPFPLGNHRAAFVAKVRAATVAAWTSAPPWEGR